MNVTLMNGCTDKCYPDELTRC